MSEKKIRKINKEVLRNRIIFVVIILLVVAIIAVACSKRGTKDNEGAPESKAPNNSSTVVEETSVNDKLGAYMGNAVNGDRVRTLISTIRSINGEAKEDEKISVKLQAFKGQVDSNGSSDSLTRVSDGIGGSFSTYAVTAEDYYDNGNIREILIKQTVGTKDDPDIPEEESNDIYLDDWFISE